MRHLRVSEPLVFVTRNKGSTSEGYLHVWQSGTGGSNWVFDDAAFLYAGTDVEGQAVKHGINLSECKAL